MKRIHASLLWISLLMWLISLGCLLFPMMARSAPACYPGDPTANAAEGELRWTDEGCTYYWFCDTGNKWSIVQVTGTKAECMATIAADKLGTWKLLTKDQKDALWNSTFTGGPAPTDSVDARMAALGRSQPLPDKAPPSGRVTTDVIAYKLTSPTNAAPTFVAVGTVAKGVPCDTFRVGDYFRIDRTKVKFPAGVLMPANVFAKCT